MVTKLGRMVAYIEEPLLIKAKWTFNTSSSKVTWQTKNIFFLLPQYLWSPNLADWSIKATWLFTYVVLQNYVTHLKHHISTITMSILVGHQTWQVVTNYEELPLIKSHDPSITWSCQIKNTMPPLEEDLRGQN